MSLEEALKQCFVSQKGNTFLYHIPADLPAFNGHFPGNPLVPGVCQFALCADAYGRIHNKCVEIKGVSRGKFIRPILPLSDIELTLTPRPDGQTLAELTDAKTKQKLSQLIFSVKEYL